MPLRSTAGPLIGLLLAIGALAFSHPPASAAMFTDAAGRRINLPDNITRILPAERNAEVLVYTLAPEKLAGSERLPGERAKPLGGRGRLSFNFARTAPRKASLRRRTTTGPIL